MLRRFLKKAFLRFLYYAPFDLGGKFMRSKFKATLPDEEFSKIVFKVAETRVELEKAFKLLQEIYVESGLTSRVYDEQRIQKFNLLPTTNVFIAMYEGEVIATMSHILDSDFGLPMDNYVDLSEIRSRRGRVAEISGLCVKKGWRSKSQGVFMVLALYSHKYSYEILGIRHFCMLTNYSAKVFYNKIFFAEAIDSKKVSYDGNKNAEGYPQVLDMDNLISKLKTHYTNPILERNLALVWSAFPWKKQCQFKTDGLPLIVSPLVEREQGELVEKMKTQIGTELNELEKVHLDNVYHLDEFKKEISLHGKKMASMRKQPRYLVNMKIKFLVGKNILAAQILDISFSGFSVFFEDSQEVRDKIIGNLTTNSGVSIKVKGSLVWKNQKKAAYKIDYIEEDKWLDFIESIEKAYDDAEKLDEIA